MLESIKQNCSSANSSSESNAEEVTDTPIGGVVPVSGSIETVRLWCCIKNVTRYEN